VNGKVSRASIASIVAVALLLPISVLSQLSPNPPAYGVDISADPVIPAKDKSLREGRGCPTSGNGSEVVGYLKDGRVGYIRCDLWQKVFVAAAGLPKIDQITLRPIIPTQVPSRTHFGSTPQLYIRPVLSNSKPRTKISGPAGFQDVTACRLVEKDLGSSGRPHMASGFPMPSDRIPLSGELVIQLIPVDFLGTRTKSAPEKDFFDATSALEKFWERQSNSRVDIQIRVPDRYISLPDRVKQYDLSSTFPNFDGQAYNRYVVAATSASDPEIDFSDVDVVILAHTPKVSAKDIGTFIAQAGSSGSDLVFKTQEGTVLNTLIQGGDTPRDLYNWIHEFGHMLGLTDSGGVGRMAFDVMLYYGIPELTVWNRFILSTLSPGQLHCVDDPGQSTHWIRPVAAIGDHLKGVVIPTSDSSAIVVESRRRLGYDAAIGRESEGALVYTVDTSKSGEPGSGPFRAIGPKRMTTRIQWSLDAPLKAGESVLVSGWKITNIESGTFGDVVRVEPAK
jgi:M6 family metalloprotease-like protein